MVTSMAKLPARQKTGKISENPLYPCPRNCDAECENNLNIIVCGCKLFAVQILVAKLYLSACPTLIRKLGWRIAQGVGSRMRPARRIAVIARFAIQVSLL